MLESNPMIVLKIYKRGKIKLSPVKEPTYMEKRESPRTDRIKKFKYKVLVPIEGEGFIQNVSQEGYGLFLDNEVPPGSVIELKMPDSRNATQPENPIAKVIWQKDYITGVKVLGR